MATLLEDTIRDLPGFLSAGQQAEARTIADRDELEGWLERFSDWTNRAYLIVGGLDDIWFEVPHSKRKQLLDALPQFLDSGSLGMKAVLRLMDSLDAETLMPLRQDVVLYFGATMALMQKINSLIDEENHRRTAVHDSAEYRQQAEADYRRGKREADEGKLTYFTPDEFLKRFG